jgi:nucleoside 2-deoxyribosyltransferase
MKPRVYLAGPDVFYPDAKERGENLKKICSKLDLEGVYPIDSELNLDKLSPVEKGIAIYNANIGLIRSCVAVVANMNPFRGCSMDVGTAFEMGFGSALRLIVVGYSSNQKYYKDRVTPDGLLIEDFDMIDNLMVHAATNGYIFSTADMAIEHIAVKIKKLVNK